MSDAAETRGTLASAHIEASGGAAAPAASCAHGGNSQGARLYDNPVERDQRIEDLLRNGCDAETASRAIHVQALWSIYYTASQKKDESAKLLESARVEFYQFLSGRAARLAAQQTQA